MDLFQHAGRKSADRGADVVLEGDVERIVFAGEGGDFTVARLKVDGEPELVTVVGALMGIPAGARLRVLGGYEDNPRFGRQFRVASFTEIAPATLEGLRRYLGSGLIKGVGPEFARRIVDRFGLRTMEILDREPERIGEVPGIGRARAAAVRRDWAASREIRKVMIFLQGHGVSPALAARVYKKYGAAAVALVRENPYRLATDVWGIGFLSADRLAGTLGIGRQADVRVDAGIRHALGEAADKGHLYLPRELLARGAAAILECDEALAQAAIDRLARDGELAIESDPSGEEAIYAADLYRAEKAVADGLARLVEARRPALDLDAERALAAYEKKSRLTLAPEQARAIRAAFADGVMVLTGGPGVGKTTIVRGIVTALGARGLRVVLAAPTGRAAKRLSEATGQPAATLHRLLEWRPQSGVFGRNRGRPLEADLLVVDEASMLDVRLAADLLAALPPGARLLLVGDVDQLPSVGPGTVLRDVIASGRVPTVRLTQIFRQAAESLIVVNSHHIRAGEAPDLGTPGATAADDRRDFFFLEEEDPARAAALVRDLVAQRLPRRYRLSPDDIQVLSPMHRGELGAGNLNTLLQDALTAGAAELRAGQRVFRQGDRVMQTRNDYDKDVFNGDIGSIERVDVGDRSLTVRFDDRSVAYDGDELDELSLAYAVTVHKAQGSEYPAVVIPVHTQHFVMLQRNLLYTAVTRGKRLVVLVGTRKALGIALRNAEIAARYSRLARRLATRAA